MMKYLPLVVIFLMLLDSVRLQAEEAESWSVGTSVAHLNFDQRTNFNISIKWLRPYSERLSLGAHYFFQRSNSFIMSGGSRTEVDGVQTRSNYEFYTELDIHRVSLIGQHLTSFGMFVNGGMGVEVWSGDYVIDYLESDDQSFPVTGYGVSAEAAIGNQWQISDNLFFGVEWVSFGTSFFEKTSVQGYFRDSRANVNTNPDQDAGRAVTDALASRLGTLFIRSKF